LWPSGHIYPTYKESFQVRWDNSIPLFLHAAIYLEVSLFHWNSQDAFSRETAVYSIICTRLHSTICTRLFRGKMHSDWFNGIEILQGRWQHGDKVGYCYPSGLEKTLCKWDIYVPLVTKGLMHHREIFAAWYEIHTISINTLCLQNVELFSAFNPMVRKVTT